jgi:hypothetical protein
VHASLEQYNLMHPIRWVPPSATSVLDVGCNVGAFLQHCRVVFPGIYRNILASAGGTSALGPPRLVGAQA